METILEMGPSLTLEQMREQLATFMADPYPVYQQMRDQTPVVRLPPYGRRQVPSSADSSGYR